MKYLTKPQICRVNELTIVEHGGNFIPPYNFLHEENLDYLVEAIQSEMFGNPLYPLISDKAGLLLFNIISNHIFQDGNKRTGLEAAILFLRINNKNLDPALTLDEIYNFTIKVASGLSTLDECQTWFAKNIVPEYLE